MSKRELLEQLAEKFNLDTLDVFLRTANKEYKPIEEEYNSYLEEDTRISELIKIGHIDFSNAERLVVVAAPMSEELTTRTGKKWQYDLTKKILKGETYDAGLFIFHDEHGNFRLSLVVVQYMGVRKQFTSFRRYTYYVSPELPNKTFINQVGRADFSSIDKLLEAFSIEAVSNEFYGEFEPHFITLANAVEGTDDTDLRKDFALLLVIRVIFLGFVQKKGWLGNNLKFIQDFLAEYQQGFAGQDLFYRDWLSALFFEALNHSPGHNVYSNMPFSEPTKKTLLMSPFLNGELFKRKKDVDDIELFIPDKPIAEFMEFLFQYNFTVEENRLYDEELEINPEFLGLIFERLVNKEYGAVYTPLIEVDLMCRLALVKWLEQNTKGISLKDLFNFLFRNMGTGEEFDENQKQGDFSSAQIRDLIELLENVTICDPAAGSGAFEVSMLHVLAEQIENLYNREKAPEDIKDRKQSEFELKKAIIANSLYGVEVKQWAVWINHLRLWLTLFVDMPEDYRTSQEPLLPNLTFKVRVGDSLVQRVGNHAFPVHGHANLPASVKARLTSLKKRKSDFFYNQSENYEAIKHEEVQVFRTILEAQIDEKRGQIASLHPQLKQQDWIDVNKIEQMQLAEQEDLQVRRDALQDEIAILRSQIDSLLEQRPFLWSLEFSEVFIERGGFDIIIGNPPYVRQEEIADPSSDLDPADYKQALRNMLLLDFSDYFAKSLRETDVFKKYRKPNGRSDLYTYFYLRSLRLLNSNGIHVFICSNSWLDVGYGAWVQEFLLRTTPVHFIIDNHAKRSFASSDVNTIISVSSAPQHRPPKERVLRFVAFKKPFEETVFAENLWAVQSSEKTTKHDDFRVFPISAAELLREGSSMVGRSGSQTLQYVGDKWGGKYLRAPDIFFTILEKGKGKLVRLGDIADVRFGIKTGANNFFYLRPLGPGSRHGLMRVQNGTGWEGELEEEFLKLVIKSPRECRTIKINPDDLQFRIFMCNKSREELHSTKALDYIEWGERQEITITRGQNAGETITGYHNIRSLRDRRFWWSLPQRNPRLILWPMIHNDRLACFWNESKVEVDHNLFEISITPNRSLFLLSILIVLIRELFGRANLGEGALKTDGIDIKKFLILNEDIHISKDISLLLENYEIEDIFSEVGINPNSEIEISKQIPNPNAVRRKIDDLIFDELSLTKDERIETYRATCQLIWNRLCRAKNL